MQIGFKYTLSLRLYKTIVQKFGLISVCTDIPRVS